jgi:putative ABC transport system permease protein
VNLDAWREVAEGWWRHRFRTAVTAGSVAWGVFLLVVLLAAGTGLENNLRWDYRDDAINSIWLWSGVTTRPWKGQRTGRDLEFDNADYDWLADQDYSEAISGRFHPGGNTTMKWGGRVGNFSIRSTHPGHQDIELSHITSGRFLNDRDVLERRKVAVIGERVQEFLFGETDPIGEVMVIGDAAWTVVGVFTDEGGARETQMVYIPVSTAQVLFGGGERLDQLMFTVPEGTDAEASVAIEAELRAGMGARLVADPEDRAALRIRNNLERFSDVQRIFTWLRAFTWLVGLGTVAAGAVGVGNIMLISVQERTAEIGLRKALGATPKQLIRMIVFESVALTAVSGYAGLVLAVALVQAIPDNEYLRAPSVELPAALVATVVLVFTGVLAGWFPARRAASIPATEALRA